MLRNTTEEVAYYTTFSYLNNLFNINYCSSRKGFRNEATTKTRQVYSSLPEHVRMPLLLQPTTEFLQNSLYEHQRNKTSQHIIS